MDQVTERIIEYFRCGYSYQEIIHVMMALHSFTLSMRKLHRILRSRGLYRKGHQSSTTEVLSFIGDQISGSGACVGYRQMHQRCVQHGLKVTRKRVSIIQKIIDPDGVALRSKNCLRRRLYYSRGPNWVWHIDGYDKLKPYGFSIHGAIDGFSRKLLWLTVSRSNKDPQLVCSFFLRQVIETGVPRKVVGDRGTENIYVAAAQRFFRRSHQDQAAKENSFRYGRSVSNQRIEAWWAMLRRSCTDWWISFFKDLIDQGVFDTTDNIHIECARFCFGKVLQDELLQVKLTWNNHRIRPNTNSHNGERPSGRPNILYYTPQFYNPTTEDYKYGITAEDVDVVKEACCVVDHVAYLCSEDFYTLASIIMSENNLFTAKSSTEALQLFVNLIQLINQI